MRSFLHLVCELCGAERVRTRVLAPAGARLVCVLDERLSLGSSGGPAAACGRLELFGPDVPAQGPFEALGRPMPCLIGEASPEEEALRMPAELRELNLRRSLSGLDFELDLWFDGGRPVFANDRAVRAMSLLELFGTVLEEGGLAVPAFPHRRRAEGTFDPPIIGGSPAMLELKRDLCSFAASDVSILIEGESGTGKEVVARNAHRLSPRRSRPIVITSAMEMPHSLLQSELFGHAEGAFTGASRDRIGLIEGADGGTFFLDEIGELPLALQATLLRVLQEKEVRRLGESRRRRVDARFVFATNRDLGDLMRRGRFRPDLYYRVAAVRVRVPPLRLRPEDIVPLAVHFLECCAARAGRRAPSLSCDAVRRLVAYRWPGNVRELKNEMERVFALHGREGVIGAAMLSPHIEAGGAAEAVRGAVQPTIPEAVEGLERAMIAEALARFAGNKTRAAEALGITRQGLFKKLKRLGEGAP